MSIPTNPTFERGERVTWDAAADDYKVNGSIGAKIDKIKKDTGVIGGIV